MCLSRYILHLRATALASGAADISPHVSHVSDLHFAHPNVGSRSRWTLFFTDPEVDALSRSLAERMHDDP